VSSEKDCLTKFKKRFKIADFLNFLRERSRSYKIRRKYNSGNFYTWKIGYKKVASERREVKIPLWVLIEISKALSNTSNEDNEIAREIEKNVVYYSSWGMGAPITNPKLPLRFTPELISIFFHLCGDGHVGIGQGDCSHYRQTNRITINLFRQKLKNVFGDFRTSQKDSFRVIIPRIITEFYRHYFAVKDFSWKAVRIPRRINELPKNFLLAGLAAFIVDEGRVEDFVEIYSKNKKLLSDIREIVINLGYKVSPIRPKYRYGKLDTYRFTIQPESLVKLYKDIKLLQHKFETCGLAHKENKLKQAVKVRNRKWKRRKFGKTKEMILMLLKKHNMKAWELASKLNIRVSSTREHLLQLERKGLVKRGGKRRRAIIWSLRTEI
jgi:hypothetical protein